MTEKKIVKLNVEMKFVDAVKFVSEDECGCEVCKSTGLFLPDDFPTTPGPHKCFKSNDFVRTTITNAPELTNPSLLFDLIECAIDQIDPNDEVWNGEESDGLKIETFDEDGRQIRFDNKKVEWVLLNS